MSPTPSLFDVAARAGVLDTFLAAIRTAGLVTLFRRTRPLTILAPTDEACAKFAFSALVGAHTPGARTRARRLVANHIVPRLLHVADLLRIHQLETSLGERLVVSVEHGIVTLNRAPLREADIRARNGTLHIIDAVLIPSGRPGKPLLLGSST